MTPAVEDAAIKAYEALELAAGWIVSVASRYDRLCVELEGLVAQRRAVPDQGDEA